MSLLEFFTGKHLDRGLHVPEHKDPTSHLPIRRLPFAPMLVVPLSQHAGVPAIPIVHEGQEVVRGEPIAKAGGFVSVPMHAPATGRVSKIALAPSARGDLTMAIYITPYQSASQEILYGAPQDIDRMTPEEIVQAVQNTGVVGLGGAAFPTHVKLKPPEGKKIDTVVVNGCECEPYLTTDHRVMLEQPASVLAGARIAMRALGARKAVIGVEDNKPDAVDALRDAIDRQAALRGAIDRQAALRDAIDRQAALRDAIDREAVLRDAADKPAAAERSTDITVEAVPAKYPQGAEKMLVKVLLGREVPSRGLPADVGLAVFNVATLAQIGELLPVRRGLIERVVTITGPGVRKPGNYLVALGTPVRWALEQADCTDQVSSVILGGPMMGAAVGSLEVPITKGVTGILVLTHKEVNGHSHIYPCIHCAACVDVCPIHLNPSHLGMLARKDRYEEMETDYHLMDCFECACCSYVCPSHIPLVQYFRIAKQMNRERKARA